MGIRAVCPNGHRLHLKEQIAGRRGLCPDCGARFRIPTESSDVPQPFAEPPKRRAKSTEEAEEIPMALPLSEAKQPTTVVESEVVVKAEASPAPRAEASPAPRAEASPAPVSPPTFEVDNVGLDAPVAATQAAAVGPPAAPAKAESDLLSQSPHALWYVQPPTGGRYGPAKSDVIRQWISEGRITESCLVWRDGWPEWQSASTILGSSSPDADSSGGMTDGVFPVGTTNVRHRSKGSKGLGVSMIVILALACIVLLVILFSFISSGRISL